MRFPNALFAAVASFLFFPAISGCDRDSSTPESIARAALSCLKRGDYSEFQKLCVSKEHIVPLIDEGIAARKAEGRDFRIFQNIKDNLDEFHKHLTGEQKEVFELVLGKIDWSGISEKSIEKRSKVENGIAMYRVELELSNGQTLLIDDIVKTASGYRIFEDAPVWVR